MKTLTDLFKIEHGNKLDLNKMKRMSADEGGVNFVGRSGRRQGIAATVAPVAGVQPYPAGLITVALGGTRLLTSFVQERPFYTAQNVDVLTPRGEMTFAEKVYACLCIRKNRFKYSAFGREANRTLHALRVPDPKELPWIASSAVKSDAAAPMTPGQPLALDMSSWRSFRLGALFEIKRGQGITKNDRKHGETPYIGALDRNNGLVGYVAQPPAHPANTISLNWNGIGGVGVAFYQPEAYWCSGDVVALYPRFQMTSAIAMFLVTMIRRERYRFSFGRKLTGSRMSNLEIMLPATSSGDADWDFMDRYVKRLPFSSQI